MADIKTVFEDAIVTKIPTAPPPGSVTSEPNTPDLPGRTGGKFPEVHRDRQSGKPSFKVPGDSFIYGR
jgi:hypothetical protein